MLGRQKSSIEFSSGKNIGNIRSSKTSSNISPFFSYSNTFEKLPDDHDRNSDLNITSPQKIFSSLEESSQMNDNCSSNVVPTSHNDLENDIENEQQSVKGNMSHATGNRNETVIRQPINCYNDCNSKIRNPLVSNNVGVDDEKKHLDSIAATSLLARTITNVSSHNSSKITKTKTQTSFKYMDPTTMKSDEMKNTFVEVEGVREIGRFSPLPTPYVDFPFQFNFGSTYASSVTLFFDN